MNNNKICYYYSLHGKDDKNRGLLETLMRGMDYLEQSHDIIQWIFPTDQASEYSNTAPILNNDDIFFLRNNSLAQSMIVISFTIYCAFLGFDYDGDDLKINPALIKSREPVWLQQNNHNHLRITRMIRSLHLFAKDDLALLFYNFMKKNYRKNENITEETWEYWKGENDRYLEDDTNGN